MPYQITIGKFDHKLGPICLFASKNEDCHLDKSIICNGFNCKLIKDAINVKEGKFVFERFNKTFQGGKFKISDSSKRGGCERFVYLILIPSEISKIKLDIIENFTQDLINDLENKNNDMNLDDFIEFRTKWEKKLYSVFNLSEMSDLLHFIREKLNLVSLNIELALDGMKEQDCPNRQQLVDALENIFEIEKKLV